MANVYDDFDKRAEHAKRFAAIVPKEYAPLYDAPAKTHSRPREHPGEPHRQQNLGEELLAVTPARHC